MTPNPEGARTNSNHQRFSWRNQQTCPSTGAQISFRRLKIRNSNTIINHNSSFQLQHLMMRNHRWAITRWTAITVDSTRLHLASVCLQRAISTPLFHPTSFNNNSRAASAYAREQTKLAPLLREASKEVKLLGNHVEFLKASKSTIDEQLVKAQQAAWSRTALQVILNKK